MSGRFAKAKNVNEYWANLLEGKECVTFFSDDELIKAGITKDKLAAENYVKAKPYLEDIDKFDADFFKINSREASLMDPQHRIFLECAYEALEDSGYMSDKFHGDIGLFAGCDTNTYLLNNVITNNPDIIEEDPLEVKMNDKDYLCTRVAYKLNLTGPAVMVQSACSTSFAAIHMASESILSGECDMALAGAISLTLPAKKGYFYKPGGVVSKNGHCKAFDKDADGTVYGDGVGVLVLKRLSDAIEDNDNIYAIIKGSVINNDGADRSGFTAPGLKGQSKVITDTLEACGVDPKTISYVETHGTGTSLGDAIEIQGLTEAYQKYTKEKQFCAIGSNKPNIGHISTASGMASIIKVALALKNEVIPKTINYQQANEKIDFKNSPFYVNVTSKSWKRSKNPRRAGISAFGLGGTNAHLILEEAPLAAEEKDEKEEYLMFNLSAKTSNALKDYEERLAQYIKKEPDLSSAAYTLQNYRKAYKYRSVVIGKNREEIEQALKERKANYESDLSQDRQVVFMFPGVGEEYEGMLKELYDKQPLFKKHFLKCAHIIKEKFDFDIVNELLASKENNTNSNTNMMRNIFHSDNTRIENFRKIQYIYVLNFSIEYAIAKFLIEIGIKPHKMIGYSIGEYVAACLAGVFTLEDTIYLLYIRGKLIEELPTGSMLSVMLPVEKLQPIIGDSLSISAIDSSKITVVGGEVDEITALQKKLLSEGIASKQIKTSHAFHSKMMIPALDKYRDILAKVSKKPPKVKFISNITGKYITDEEAVSSEYWCNHMLKTVQFAKGIKTILADNEEDIFVEAGIGNTLSTFVLQDSVNLVKKVVAVTKTYYEKVSDIEKVYRAIARLWVLGVEVDWQKFFGDKKHKKISVPTYPFEKKSYWIEGNIKKLSSMILNNYVDIDNKNEAKANRMELNREDIKSLYKSPVTPTQDKVLEIFKDTLGYDNLGVEDNFFEIGGNSLLAINVNFQVVKKFNVEIPLELFYNEPTVTFIADYIDTYNWYKEEDEEIKESSESVEWHNFEI